MSNFKYEIGDFVALAPDILGVVVEIADNSYNGKLVYRVRWFEGDGEYRIHYTSKDIQRYRNNFLSLGSGGLH